MIRRVWVTRAEPGASRTAARLTARGFEAVVAPLLAIRAIPQPAPDLTGVAALALTSRNGVDAFAALTGARTLPVFTVGDATAEAARGAGFGDVRSAGGDLSDLVRLLAAEGPRDGLVLAPGALEPSGDLPALLAGTIAVRALPVYAAIEIGTAPPEAFDAVLIHSPRAARALSASGVRGGLAVVISAAAGEPLMLADFAAVRIAAEPTDTAMLEALGNPAPAV